ncbi:hypothetical protein Fcan01_21416 [Folsomia candida]|uniref:28S ribosomal protein S17, mitochondrial n=2 Tax=Folsomia candida TaxID=158441 RepID=A0A226DFG4_FOLCA|nr:hypothetical protein Fcan01_21416 [Folsomia candida]
MGSQAVLQTLNKATTQRLFLASCYPCEIPSAHRVNVQTMDFDGWLKMYFTKWISYYAHDTTGKCKEGDIVLVEELPQRLTRDITHQIKRIVYPFGDMVDPVTGKKCYRTQYRDDVKRINELWGVNPGLKYDYDKAPPRGWQEGRKDWTHKKGYRKFHEFTDRDQPEASW